MDVPDRGRPCRARAGRLPCGERGATGRRVRSRPQRESQEIEEESTIKENIVRILGVLVLLGTIAVTIAALTYMLSGGHTSA